MGGWHILAPKDWGLHCHSIIASIIYSMSITVLLLASVSPCHCQCHSIIASINSTILLPASMLWHHFWFQYCYECSCHDVVACISHMASAWHHGVSVVIIASFMHHSIFAGVSTVLPLYPVIFQDNILSHHINKLGHHKLEQLRADWLLHMLCRGLYSAKYVYISSTQVSRTFRL